jgi:hypothetical protein
LKASDKLRVLLAWADEYCLDLDNVDITVEEDQIRLFIVNSVFTLALPPEEETHRRQVVERFETVFGGWVKIGSAPYFLMQSRITNILDGNIPVVCLWNPRGGRRYD